MFLNSKNRLEIEVESNIDDGKIKSLVKIIENDRVKKIVKVADYKAIALQGVQDKDIFSDIRIKKFLIKSLELFEPKKIIINIKEK